MPFSKRADPFYQAQDILSRRDHSEFELRTKMRRKGFGMTQIDEVVTKLKKVGLLNDDKFAIAYTENILLFKPVGPRWIKHKLKQKGIAPSIIDQALAAMFHQGREVELARQAAVSWQRVHPLRKEDIPRRSAGAMGDKGGGGRIPDTKLLYIQRLTRCLAARGFSYSAIESAVSDLA